jgi:hypothetical protein
MALNPAFTSPSTRKLPFACGYVLGAGDKVLETVTLNGAQYALFILGEGEWDGYEMVNTYAIQGNGTTVPTIPPHLARGSKTDLNPLLWAEETANVLHFHSGAYTPIGTTIPVVDPTTGLIPINSSQDPGPSQGYDPWFSQFPSVTPPQSFNGMAYAIFYSPPPGTYLRGNFTPGTISGTCVWRTTKCRIFDAYGNVVSYGFTCNPAWHKVEAILRYKIRPQHPPIGGLTDAEKACFNWESIVELAARNDHILPNGKPRFTGNYIFAADATLTNMMETMMRVDRSYQREEGGQIYLIGDDARASVFIASAKHLVPGSLKLDKKDVSKAPNMFVPQYRDLDIPAVCEVQTGVGFGAFYLSGRLINGFRALTCSTPSPFANESFMTYGGCSDPTWDGDYRVNVFDESGDPYPVGSAHPNTTYTIMPTPAGTPVENVIGGYLGSNDARFSSRAPTGVQHRSAQKMVAQQALGLTVQPRINRVNYDCGNSTFDQTNRLMKFERDSQLGTDTGASWTAPIGGTLSLYFESTDTNAAQLPKVVKRHEVITLDSWLFPEGPGDYKVQDMEIRAESNASSGQVELVADLTITAYNRDAYTDESDPPGNQYTTVPGSSLALTGFTPTTFTGYPLQATLGITADVSGDGNLTIAIPDLSVQVLGQVAPTAFPLFKVTGVPRNTMVTLYINYPTGLSNPPTYNWVAGSTIAGTYVIVVARGVFTL